MPIFNSNSKSRYARKNYQIHKHEQKQNMNKNKMLWTQFDSPTSRLIKRAVSLSTSALELSPISSVEQEKKDRKETKQEINFCTLGTDA